MRIPSILDRERYPSLDGFRAVSIALVLLSHFFYDEGSVIYKMGIGFFGVQIFFVISGILITTLLLKEKVATGDISLKSFYIRRFLRIFPVAYLFLLVLLLLNSIFTLEIKWQSIASGALYIKNTSILPGGDWYTGHFWSLSVEEQFYLMFPFLLTTMPLRYYAALLGLLIAISPVLNYVVVHQIISARPVTLVNEVINKMPPIFIGSLTAVLLFEFGSPRILSRLKAKGFISIVLFLLAGLIQSNKTPIPTSFNLIIVSLLIVIMILINLVDDTGIVFRFLNHKTVVYVGVLSYSLYVWQQVFSHVQPWANLFPGADSGILNFVSLLLVSYISYNFFEKKFLKIKQRFHEQTAKA